jgi:hypothetical protein
VDGAVPLARTAGTFRLSTHDPTNNTEIGLATPDGNGLTTIPLGTGAQATGTGPDQNFRPSNFDGHTASLVNTQTGECVTQMPAPEQSLELEPCRNSTNQRYWFQPMGKHDELKVRSLSAPDECLAPVLKVQDPHLPGPPQWDGVTFDPCDDGKKIQKWTYDAIEVPGADGDNRVPPPPSAGVGQGGEDKRSSAGVGMGGDDQRRGRS